MNLTVRILAVLLLLALAVAGALQLLGQGSDRPDDDPRVPGLDPNQPAAAARSAEAGSETEAGPPARTEVAADATGAARPVERLQGFRARVVDADGVAVPDAEIRLFEGPGDNLLTATLMAQRRVRVPPVDLVTPQRDGSFEIGVRDVLAPSYELRISHPQHATRRVGGLRIQTGAWSDLGDLSLPRGLALTGRITVEGRPGFPIPAAAVTVLPAASSTALTPDAASTDTLETTTDAAGFYTLANVPAGIVTVRAVAAGFAQVDRPAVQITAEQANRVDLELPKGSSIAGRVVDARGAPVPQALLTALSISSRNPLQADTRSGADGSFEILGLRAGPYQVTVAADGHAGDRRQPIQAGTSDLLFELRDRGTVPLKVVDADEQPLALYDVVLKRYHPADDSFGNVPDARLERVRERDLEADGSFRYRGVDPGTYVFELRAAGHAKTFSEPFSVPDEGDGPLVETRMLRGARLHGRVLDADGNPLAGVRLSTMPTELQDTAFTKMFAQLMTFRATRTETESGSDGRFVFEHLAPADYRLSLSHPQHTATTRTDLPLTEGEDHALGDVPMSRGTRLVGRVLVNGSPAAQVKVSVTSFPDPTDPTRAPLLADTVTDDRGRFELAERLPPGRYTARAARLTLTAPLLQVLDQKRTQTDFDVRSGQREHELHLEIQDG